MFKKKNTTRTRYLLLLAGSGACILTVVTYFGYLVFFLSQPVQPTPTSENKVPVVVAVGNISAGSILDSRSVYVVYYAEESVPEGVFGSVEEVVGKIAKTDLSASDVITTELLMLLEELTVDVLVAQEHISAGAIVTEKEVYIAAVPYRDLGMRPVLKGFDYYYLGEIRALENIAPGSIIDTGMVSFEPLEDYYSAIGEQQEADTISNLRPMEVLPSREQVLEITNLSVFGSVISCFLGIVFAVLLSGILRET